MEVTESFAKYNKGAICRICMQIAKNSFHIYREIFLDNKSLTVAEIINECTKYPVTQNDLLPVQVCYDCVEMAKNAHRFKLKTEKAYYQLKALYDITWFPKQEQGSYSGSDMGVRALTTNKYTQTEKTSVFQCEICPQKFFVESEIRHHRATSHINDGKKCRVCGDSFIHLGQLKIHLSTAHPDEGIRCDFRCNICSREFTRKDHLKRHLIRVHKLEYTSLNITKVSLDEPEIENPPVLTPSLNNYSSHWPDYQEEDDKEPIAIDDQKNQTINATNPFSSEDEGLDHRDYNDMEDEDVKQFVETITQPEISIKVEKPEISYDQLKDKNEKISKFTNSLPRQIKTDLKPEKTMDNLNKHNNDNDNVEDFESHNLNSSFEEHHSNYNSSEDHTEEEYEPYIEDDIEDNSESTKRSKTDTKSIKEEEHIVEQNESPTSSTNKIKNEINSMLKKPRRHYGAAKTQENRCKECDRTFTRYNHLLRHMLTHSDAKPHICGFCSKAFSRSDHLQKHIQSIHCEKNFKCDQCPSAYGRKDHLQRHIETRHNKDPNAQRILYDCDMCEKKFTTKAYLVKHKLLHTDRLYACKHCSETFQEKELMKEHQKKVHTQPRNFLCNICGDSFQRNEYLKIHMRRHTGEKPYKCSFCEKGFPRSTDLKMHERYHMGHKPNLCNLCGKGFHRPYNLTIHMRTHTGEKPYKCNQCPQAFAQSNDLKAHIRRHTGERFRCDICSAAFLQRYGLNAHLRTVHGIIVTSFTGRLRKTDQPIDTSEQQVDQQQQQQQQLPVPTTIGTTPTIDNPVAAVTEGIFFPRKEILSTAELLQPQQLPAETQQQPALAVVTQEPSHSSLPCSPPLDSNVTPAPLYLGHHFINPVALAAAVTPITSTSPIVISSTHPSSTQHMNVN